MISVRSFKGRQENEKHALVGADWFDEIADNQVISDQIRYHMANYQSNKLGNDHLAYITYIADNIASGVDRRQSNEESDEDASAKIWDTYTNQADIFNIFGAQTDKRYFKPTVLNLKSKPNFASATYEPFSKVIMRQLRLVSKMNWQNLSLIKHKLTLC